LSYRKTKVLETLRSKPGVANELFKAFDSDGNGQIDLNEFKAGLRSCGCILEPQEYSFMFNFIDIDSSGDIDIEEFSKFLSTHIDIEELWKTSAEDERSEVDESSATRIFQRGLDTLVAVLARCLDQYAQPHMEPLAVVQKAVVDSCQDNQDLPKQLMPAMPLLLELLLALSAIPERPVLAIKLLNQAVIIADGMAKITRRMNHAKASPNKSPHRALVAASSSSPRNERRSNLFGEAFEAERDAAKPTTFEAAAANARHLRASLGLQMRSDLVSAALDSTHAIKIGERLVALGIEGWEAHVQQFKTLSDRIATMSPAWAEKRRII
jgi:hypothetical protein